MSEELDLGPNIQLDKTNKQVVVTYKGRQQKAACHSDSLSDAMKIGQAIARQWGWKG